MSRIHHICQAGSAAALVEQVTGTPVSSITDDGAIGPLHDIDADDAKARLAFWLELLSEQRKFGTKMRTADVAIHLRADVARLAKLWCAGDEVVIWAGAHPTEQALRRRVHWWLADCPLTVSEVSVTHDEVETRGAIHAPIALADRRLLSQRLAQRTVLQAPERRELAAEWRRLRDLGQGVRVYEAGQLVERPIHFYDASLRNLIDAETRSETEPLNLRRLVGQAMVATGRSDTFCLWRVARLLGPEKLTLADTPTQHDAPE